MSELTCADCNIEMTPKNSRRCPELFLCDECAMKRFGPDAAIGISANGVQLNIAAAQTTEVKG